MSTCTDDDICANRLQTTSTFNFSGVVIERIILVAMDFISFGIRYVNNAFGIYSYVIQKLRAGNNNFLLNFCGFYIDNNQFIDISYIQFTVEISHSFGSI